MPNSSTPNKVLIYCILTLGLYFLYWSNKSRKAVNASAKMDLVPGVWQLVLPFINFLWMWKYSQALERVTYKRIRGNDTFLLYTAAIIGPGTIFGFISDFMPDEENVNSDDLVIILLIALVSWIITLAVALGLFCKIMQSKLNRLPKQR